MIRPLRKAHWMASLGLAVAAPAVLGLSLALRQSPPVHRGPLPGFPASTDLPDLVAGRNDSLGIVVMTEREAGLVISLSGPLRRPDVVAYWLAPDPAEPLSQGTLLGPVGSSRNVRYSLPREAPASGGRLVLYSAAHREVLTEFTVSPWAEP